ncbi:UPF0310 protein [Fibrisoma limi BUZ 3]|uniref:UPF0310 protein BN8_01997 n=1 Tax=Fibrisoma limi BUZ 3 TaxID=1185876 RepID=I2GGC5_9BACT|nr:EVE domain-containing protein [Fibrisoma limi]CCH52950.1 UPF0310 protein [Fibrisoma limi BUZ 3]
MSDLSTVNSAKPVRYWLIVAARDHVLRGVEGGFCQANHGSARNLKRMQNGDGVAFYSPKLTLGETTPLRAFTAIGWVQGDAVYQTTVSPDFEPFRRDITFLESHEAPIAPLIPALHFIKNKTNWGITFRFGFLEIPEDDFLTIAAHMGVNPG